MGTVGTVGRKKLGMKNEAVDAELAAVGKVLASKQHRMPVFGNDDGQARRIENPSFLLAWISLQTASTSSFSLFIELRTGVSPTLASVWTSVGRRPSKSLMSRALARAMMRWVDRKLIGSGKDFVPEEELSSRRKS